MFRFFLLFISSVLAYASNVIVAAAANTTYAMPEIVRAFNKKHPDVHIKFVLASSGKLTAQIMHGAPYDVFMSADMKYPEFLYKNGFAKTEPKVYAKGALALFSVKNIPVGDFKKAVLESRTVAIANPKTAPYGKAAVEALKNAGVYDKVKNRLVYSESVAGVIPYTVHEADVGIVAKSALYSKKLKKYKNFSDVPKSLYTPIKQGAVLIKNTQGAEQFYKFIFSDEAKTIFRRYGYVY